MSKSKFFNTFSEFKITFALEQNTIILSFVKMLRFYWDIRYIDGMGKFATLTRVQASACQSDCAQKFFGGIHLPKNFLQMPITDLIEIILCKQWYFGNARCAVAHYFLRNINQTIFQG